MSVVRNTGSGEITLTHLGDAPWPTITMDPTMYLDEIAGRIRQIAEPDSVLTPNGVHLYRLYALLATTSGINTTLEQVHDAWAIWQYATFPNHRSLVPFAQLSPEVQALDAPYRDAIVAVAREMRARG